MKLNFEGQTNTNLPAKKYIDLSDIKNTDNDIKQKDEIEKGKTAIQEFTSKLANPSQVFTINNQQTHNITCKNGTTLQIKPNTFVNHKNETIQGNVQLELKEAYSFTDIVGNNLHTVSNGSLLQSGGMIYVNATQEMQQLGIDIKNPIQLIMPTSNKLNDMQLFNLDNGNWIPNGQMQNVNSIDNSISTFNPISFSTNSYSRNSIKVLNITDSPVSDYTNFKNERVGKFVIPKDCSYSNEEIRQLLKLRFGNWYDKIIIRRSWKNEEKLQKQKDSWGFTYRIIGDSINLPFNTALKLGLINNKDSLEYEIKNRLDSVAFLESLKTDSLLRLNPALGKYSKMDSAYATHSKNYNFNIRNFGWINCDRFVNSKNKTDFKIIEPNDTDVHVGSLIFIVQKGIIPGMKVKNSILFSNIPNDESVVYLAFKYTKDKVLTCIQQLTTSKEPAKAEDFIELSPAQVKAKLDALGTVQ